MAVEEGREIVAPGGRTIAAQAIAYENANGVSEVVDPGHPLPVRLALAGATAAALAGTAGATGIFGPFVPELARPIWVTLAGTWTGTVQLLRSTDGGTTKRPLTYPDGSPRARWTGPVNAPVAEESCAGATWWLGFERLTGELAYEVRQ